MVLKQQRHSIFYVPVVRIVFTCSGSCEHVSAQKYAFSPYHRLKYSRFNSCTSLGTKQLKISIYRMTCHYV